MKDKPPTYTIKPLEWRQQNRITWQACDGTIISLVEYADNSTEYVMNIKACNHWLDGFKTLEAAKAKAQELHEAELMKYLQEVEG